MRGREAHGHTPAAAGGGEGLAGGAACAHLRRPLGLAPRYAKATAFFLGDLYGAKDFSGRDEAMLRIYPVMVRTLPRGAVETAALAIEVDALSEDLDRRVAAALETGPMTEPAYAQAYRQAGTRAERVRQIELIDDGRDTAWTSW